MTTALETSELFRHDPANWRIALMDFVDDVRYYRNPAALSERPKPVDERLDAMLSAVVETLSTELGVRPPKWVNETPSCSRAWFVSGLENLKAIALTESPLPFRLRQIFVLENFLIRV